MGPPPCKGKNKAKEVKSSVEACCPSQGLRTKPQKRGIDIAGDPESQATGIEHVSLSISGMTCTGCETKLHRVLVSLPGIGNLKTSLVLSRAEFDVQLALSSVDAVMKHLERMTEFKCERISYHGSSMVIMPSQDPLLFANRPWPDGVLEISPVEKNNIRVVFNPDIIGARDLMEKHWAGMAKLAPLDGDPALTAGSKHVRNVGWMTLLSAVLTVPVLIFAWARLPGEAFTYDCVSLALATIVQVMIAGPFYPKALKALIFSRVIEMDFLIVLSTSAAYIFSVVSFGYLAASKPLSIGQFFETSTLLVTLIMTGRYIAALARQKAVESISIRSLQTRTALLVKDTDLLETREIDCRLLQYGDRFKVLPEMRIPTDGTVICGSSETNESMFTGNAQPIEKHTKSQVIAGTINGPGTLVVRVTRLPGSNTVDNIANMVDEAKLSKPKMQDLADKVASYFVPVVCGVTIITFVIWVAIGLAVQKKARSEAMTQSITYAIAVLIVSCPCAIGLAVPMVVVIAGGLSAQHGVIFKSANAIEITHKTSHVVLDKTGTLTQGKLTVVSQSFMEGGKASLHILLGLINDSKHPVSMAVGDYLKNQGVVAEAKCSVKSLPGKGMEARTDTQLIQAGNSRWLNLTGHALIQPILDQGHTAFCFAIDGHLCAVFGLEDSLRPDAAWAVAKLQERGMSVHVVSGDDAGATHTMTSALGIREENVRAGASPAEKQAYVRNLLASGITASEKVVVFCGDGTNDAAALAQATVGVHVNGGSDLAESAADVVLMRPGLGGLLAMMDVSKLATNRIKFNFAWSFVYNLFAILLAAGAFLNARIPPEFAGLGELVSVLPVVAAAVLLRWSKLSVE
ncbi:hypothetical protein N7492_001454 [Penicillium capsulatum]|uniref:HMA domain-containing protein n=1 Tax=Penicillium capsulatum TaxID=69766 RepID=A0A9W9IRK0_9EURO|nr:hypothetical protein N7492_001454 [Penicillium capsulatum]KAJ6129492.1 hypothetical protein N7512_002272 [Penicillium capsulatum]